jgi:hypothetical protein
VVTAVAPGIATITVNAAGTGTGFSATTLTGAATVTVSALPAGLTALTVTPSSVTLSQGGTTTVVANATQPSGAAAATFTYGTTAPAVATVSSAGVITAVGAGSAVITVTATSAANSNFGAATLSATVAVTVSPAAQVAITSITREGTFFPVNVNEVTGQIEVTVNVATNGNVVSSAQLFACAVGATCPAAGQNPVAQQTFGAAGAASGNIVFNVNTAAFRVNSDWSAATVDFANGQQILIATVTTAGGTSSATSNNTVLNFVNTDGFAARHTAPTTTAVDAANNRWFGGPNAAGRGSVTIVPVTYTTGRSVASVTTIIGSGAGQAAGCTTGAASTTGTGNMTFSTQARPWTFSYGRSLGSGLNATNIVCSGNSTIAGGADVVPFITSATDNNNVSYPTTFLTSSTTSPAVTAPAVILGDWAAPTAASAAYTFVAASANQSVVPGSTWVGGSYNFADGDGSTSAAVNVSATETGVGLATTPTLEVTGCGATTWTLLTTNTSADVAECATDVSAAAYSIRYSPADRLGNAQVWTSSTGTNPAPAAAVVTFGVDKTAPLVRWSASTDANGSLISTAAVAGTEADTIFSAEAIDDRAGLNVAQSSMSRAATGTTALRNGVCALGSLPTGTSSLSGLYVTNPACTNTTGTNIFAAAALVDGYRMIVTGRHTRADLNAVGNGYYTQQVRVFDRAGNSALTDKRYVLLNTTVGTITVTDPAAFFSATSGLTVTASVTPTVETASNALEAQYGAFGGLRFPAVASGKTAFDDVALTSSEAVSVSLPFTSGTTLYTSIEQTTAGNEPGGANFALSNVGIWGTTFTGISSSATAAGAFTGSVITADNTAWRVAGATNKGLNITTFAAVDSTAAFNSPAGGLKARVITTAAQTASPFARVDFYAVVAGGYSYLGSVSGASSDVYYSDNGLSKSWTYVLRSAVTDYTGAAQRWRGAAEVAALNAAVPAPAVPFVATQIIAVATGTNLTTATGVTAPAGRALASQVITLP